MFVYLEFEYIYLQEEKNLISSLLSSFQTKFQIHLYSVLQSKAQELPRFSLSPGTVLVLGMGRGLGNVNSIP